MSTHLFVGGAADGMKREVEDQIVAKGGPWKRLSIEGVDRFYVLETYYPHMFAAGDRTWIIYAVDGIEPTEIMERLIRHYTP